MKALDEEIHKEWDVGIGQLSPSYNHLFSEDEDKRLNDTVIQKLMWIISVWTA
jgi:hypothetical protein